MATADFNCDGLMDVVVANGDGTASTFPISILLANGQGGFADGTSQVAVGALHQTRYPSGIVLADFNGDGRTDVFIPDTVDQTDGASSGYQSTLLLSMSNCQLTDGTSGIPQQLTVTRSAAAADVDGDGDVDLYVANNWGPTPAVPPQVWLNDGAGHFSIAQNALPAALTNVNVVGFKGSAFVDVNGDGFNDLVLGGDQKTATSVVLLNDGSGRFTQLANAIPAKPFGTSDVVMDIKSADFNHDGKPDLVFAERIHSGPRGRWFQILINNGDGTFSDQTAQRFPQNDNTNTWFNAVSIVDIDGDGNLDLAGQLAFGVGGEVLALADASGTFTPVSLVSGMDAVFSFVDVNGNGHRDLLAALSIRVTLFPNTGAVLAPGVPQELRARSMADRVRLTWPYVWGATSYEVWRSAVAGTPGSMIGTATATRFDDLTASASVKYYTVRAVNSAGTSGSSTVVAGGTVSAPEAVTTAASSVTPLGATLNGTVNPNGASTTAAFEYGPTISYGTQVAGSPAPGSGNSPVAVSAAITGLFCNTPYQYRAVAISAGGTTKGENATFTTPVCPPPTAAFLPRGVMEDLAWDQTTDIDYLIDKMAAAGVQTVRMPFRWYMIEPTNNTFTFAFHDPIVTKLRAKGIEILGLLQHAPNWAIGSNPPGSSPPLNDADWQDYVSHVAAHYRGLVASWEVWNEENLQVFFTPQPDVVRYTQMLKVAFTAIRDADPTAMVVLGGLAGNGVYEYWQAPEKQDFLQKIYDNGGKNYFDAVAIHPYVHPVTLGIYTLLTFVQGTHDVMATNGDAAKPLWITEIGWTVDPAYLPPITETDQANWVTAVYNARPSLGVDRIYWYELHELYPPPTDVGWGLIRHDLTLRPLYYAYKGSALSPPFSDSLLVPGSSVIRAVHMTELRTRINALRVRFGLAAFSWTDAVLTPGTIIVRAAHILELRTALAQAYAAAGRPAPTYSGAAVGPGATITATQISELRTAVVVLEASP